MSPGNSGRSLESTLLWILTLTCVFGTVAIVLRKRSKPPPAEPVLVIEQAVETPKPKPEAELERPPVDPNSAVREPEEREAPAIRPVPRPRPDLDPSFPTPTGPNREWLDAHVGRPVEQLKEELDVLNAQLRERATPEIERRLDAGISARATPEQASGSTPEDQTEIVGLRVVPGEGTMRTVLPRAEFAELYWWKDQATWLEGLIRSRSGGEIPK